MRVLVQRSGKSSVSVDNEVVGSIDSGLVLFVGFTDGDDSKTIDYIVNKIIKLRIFEDESGVMNKNILEYGGDILSISQFTLYGNCEKGNRPSYIKAMHNDEAIILYDLFNKKLGEYLNVETGRFGTDMIVNITNIGPTTIWLER